jgi:transposase-like protein
MMRPDLALYLVTGVFFILLVLLTHWRWSRSTTAPATPKPTRRKRDPKPFAGYTRKPECERCEQEVASHPPLLGAPPPRLTCTRGRRRQVDTSGHFCPHIECAYHGRVDFGNIRANGHPNGRRWRQLVCLSCRGSFLETVGTPFHARHVDPDTLVGAIAALAEGLGIRAVARVFEVDPNTVLNWLIEAAEHLEAFSDHDLRDLHVEQVQLDELFAWLSAVKAGEVSDAEATQRLTRSPHWVWGAIDPITKRLLALDTGDRTLEMAQGLVHGVVEVLETV